jgi:hypothetical protein
MTRLRKGSYSPSDARKANMLARLVDEQGVVHTAKLFARVLQERFRSDPMAAAVASHLLTGVAQAEDACPRTNELL